jgi:hypothetical protein
MPDDDESTSAAPLVLAILVVGAGIVLMNHAASRPGESWLAQARRKFGPGFKVSGHERMDGERR